VALGAEPPVLIGHSYGGLFVELLLDRGLGRAGVAMSPAAAAYERYAVPESGQIFYEAGFANFHLHPPTEVHFKNADRAPLPIVGAEDDQTVPFLVGAGWEEAAGAIGSWLDGVLAKAPA
jgi:pimeloyl-ACP methyl ester carboxylesterase